MSDKIANEMLILAA